MDSTDLAIYAAAGYVVGKTALNVYLAVTYFDYIKEQLWPFPENPLPNVEKYLTNQGKRYDNGLEEKVG